MSRVLKEKENYITQKYKPNIHEAIDLVGYNNSLDYIIAHSDGIVVGIQKNYKTNDAIGRSYGNFVKIKHNNGYYTLYAHLRYKSVCVDLGDKVKKGTVIGYMGNTGHSHGSHLHFEVRNVLDQKINPTNFIDSSLQNENKKYNIGRYIVNTEVLTVRREPYINKNDDNWLKFEELTKNAKEQIKKLNKNENVPNGLIKGVICDVSSVLNNWGKIPSGWICLDCCNIIQVDIK